MAFSRRWKMTAWIALLAIPASLRAQQPITVTADETTLEIAPTRTDVRSVGMGKTGLTDELLPNAMMFNPASLATPRTRIQIFGVDASLPSNSLEAISFLRKPGTINQIKTGSFVKQIRNAVNVLRSPTSTPDQWRAAITDFNAGMQFANELQQKVLGGVGSPKPQGVAVIPAIEGQIDHFGFALFANVHMGFQAEVTEPLARLYALRLPTDFATLPLDQQLDIAGQVFGIVDPLFDPVTGDLSYQGVIPQTFAVAYMDIVGAVGYGIPVTPDLKVGALLKVVNRRFSFKVIDPDHYDGLLKEARSDFSTSSTGVTLDLGATYRIRATRTVLGASVQNLIPLPIVRSTGEVSAVVYDQAQNPVKVFVRAPLALRSPLLLNVGASQPLLRGWTVAVDWVDIAAQDEQTYGDYFERFRLGTEYRLETSPDGFAVAVRAGLADGRGAGGLGFDFWHIVRLDGAYAYDPLIAANSWFASIAFGL